MSRCAGDNSTDLAHVAHGVVEEHLNSNRHPGLRETTRSKVGLLIIWFMVVPSIIGFYPVFEIGRKRQNPNFNELIMSQSCLSVNLASFVKTLAPVISWFINPINYSYKIL